jgi:Secretion system C-terminal sorting domain
MKTSLNTIVLFLVLLFAPLAQQAQTITCSSLCVTLIANDSINNGVAVSVSIADSGFINYPYVHQILDQSNNVIGTGSMFFFGQFGTTTQIYPATSTNTNWNNFVGTVVFVFDNDTCYLPYPCPMSSTPEIDNEESFNISPNPATDLITINTQNDLNSANVEIVTLDGRSVQTMNSLRGKRIDIPTDQLANGIYIVRIMEEDRFLKSERVVISR